MKVYLSLLRQRNFALLTAADAVSMIGDQVGWMSLLWFVMVTTNSAPFMGLLALAFGLPGVVLGPIVGNVYDRWPRKPILAAAHICLGVIFTAIPMVYGMHQLSFAVLMLMAAFAGCLTPFTSVGWMVILPGLVSRDQLKAANALCESVWQAASVLGPMVAGLLIAQIGAPRAMLVDAASFLCAAVGVGLMQDSHRQTASGASPEPRRRFWQETWFGLVYLYRTKPVWWITVGAVFLNLAFGVLDVGLPLLVHREWVTSASVLGGLWMAYFLGSLCGSLCSGVIPLPKRHGWLMGCMVMGWGGCLVPLLWLHSMAPVYTLLVTAGFLFAGYPPLARTVVQRTVARDYQGRVFGIRTSLIAVGTPLGAYVGGAATQSMDATFAIGLTGLAVVGLGVSLTVSRAMRSI